MPKNIEMSVLNSEGSYDVLYPATMSNITYLTDAVSTLFDLAEGSSLDEALIRLLVGTDGYGYIITLKYPDGTPASGLTLNGITSIDGGNPVTDSNGWAFGKSNNTSVTIGMTGKNWLDVDFSSFQVQSTGTITNFNHVIPIREDSYILQVSSSQNYDENYLSPWIKSIDICGVGGGGGGGGAYRERGSNRSSSAGGGGGGYVQNSLGVVINKGDILKIQVGSGG